MDVRWASVITESVFISDFLLYHRTIPVHVALPYYLDLGSLSLLQFTSLYWSPRGRFS